RASAWAARKSRSFSRPAAAFEATMSRRRATGTETPFHQELPPVGEDALEVLGREHRVPRPRPVVGSRHSDDDVSDAGSIQGGGERFGSHSTVRTRAFAKCASQAR